MDAWGIDVVLGASQKGLGTPPGLSVLLASARAIKVITLAFQHDRHADPCLQTFETRSSRVTSYYASWKKSVRL